MKSGLLWLLYFSVGDFVIHLFREGDILMFNLQQAQVIDIAIIVVAAALWVMRIFASRKQTPAEVNPSKQNPED